MFKRMRHILINSLEYKQQIFICGIAYQRGQKVKIQLKRSNVLEGGSAKKPTAAQMEYGELAVNYNTADTAIFLKDSADQIVRIGGFKAGDNIIIDGNGNISANASYWEQTGDNLYPKTLTNNVGIGTSTPQQKLDVDGNGNFTGSVTTPHFDLEALPALP